MHRPAEGAAASDDGPAAATMSGSPNPVFADHCGEPNDDVAGERRRWLDRKPNDEDIEGWRSAGCGEGGCAVGTCGSPAPLRPSFRRAADRTNFFVDDEGLIRTLRDA